MTLDLAHIVLMAITSLMFVLIQVERHRAAKREDDLLDRVMSDNLIDYGNSPKNRLKLNKSESKLAESAYKLESLQDEDRDPGHQVT